MLSQGQATEVTTVAPRHRWPLGTEPHLLQAGGECDRWLGSLPFPPAMKPSGGPHAPSRHRLARSQRCPPSIPPTRPLPPGPVTGCKQTLPAATPAEKARSGHAAGSRVATPEAEVGPWGSWFSRAPGGLVVRRGCAERCAQLAAL